MTPLEYLEHHLFDRGCVWHTGQEVVHQVLCHQLRRRVLEEEGVVAIDHFVPDRLSLLAVIPTPDQPHHLLDAPFTSLDIALPHADQQFDALDHVRGRLALQQSHQHRHEVFHQTDELLVLFQTEQQLVVS